MLLQTFRPGDTVENPVTGERFTFVETAATTDGELLSFDLALRPGGAVPMPHVHPVQTEVFAVQEGLMRFRVGLRTRLAGPGDVLVIPPGTIHGFANAGEHESRVRVEVRPALQMERMLAQVVTLAKAGRMTERGLPRNVFELARLARTYDREAHAPLLTMTSQRMLLAPLLAMGRLRHPGSRGGAFSRGPDEVTTGEHRGSKVARACLETPNSAVEPARQELSPDQRRMRCGVERGTRSISQRASRSTFA